jgi:hypothetical protein
METGPAFSQNQGLWRRLIRWWLGLTGAKIRMLRAGDVSSEGPAVYVVNQPAEYLGAMMLAMAVERPVYCLLPRSLSGGFLVRVVAWQFNIIYYQGELATSDAALRRAVEVLANGGALLVFADPSAKGKAVLGSLATNAGAVIRSPGAQRIRRRISVHPVHLFLPESKAVSREILVYADSALTRPDGQVGAQPHEFGVPAFVAALEARIRENVFQLRPTDLRYLLTDLEEVLRADLREEWADSPDWKQDAEGFVLSRGVAERVKQTNALDPGRLMSLRKALDDYRRLQRRCALREIEIQRADSFLKSNSRRTVAWVEMVVGLPVALYGLLNHLAIILTLWLMGSFREDGATAKSNWTLRGAVTLVFYVLQVFCVAHWKGRAAAGYYAPSLPVSGAYLFWRYTQLIRSRARLILISRTTPSWKKEVGRLRNELPGKLDGSLIPSTELSAPAR